MLFLVSLSSTRFVIYRFSAILRRKYYLNTPVLCCYMPEIRAFLRRKCAANALQIACFLPVFRPQFAHKSARKHAYLTLQTRQLCAVKAPKTHPFNAANISLPERRPKTPVLRRKSTHKHACLTSTNDLKLIALTESSLTKIFALGLIVNKLYAAVSCVSSNQKQMW